MRRQASESQNKAGITLIASHSQGRGLNIARAFLEKKEPVSLAHEDKIQGEKDRQELLQGQAQAQIEYEHLDLSNLDSVHRFAQQCYQRGRRVQHIVFALDSDRPDPNKKTQERGKYHFSRFLIGPFFLAVKLVALLEDGAQLYILSPYLSKSSPPLTSEEFFKSAFELKRAKESAIHSLMLFLNEFKKVCEESGKKIQLFGTAATDQERLEFESIETHDEAPAWLMEYVLRFGSEKQNQWREYHKIGNSYGQRKNSIGNQTSY